MKSTFWSRLATISGKAAMRLPFPLWVPFEKIYTIAYCKMEPNCWFQDGQWWETEDNE